MHTNFIAEKYLKLYKIINISSNPLWYIEQVAASELNTWRILNLVRGVTAILGWIIISLRPNTDRLVKNLQKAEVNAIGDELNMGITSAA